LRLQAFWKKRSSYYEGEREDEAIYAKVKAASYDKIYAIAKAKVQLNKNVQQHLKSKEEVKLFTEEELKTEI
jgi:polyribonucleotide nucleotidyltransferase